MSDKHGPTRIINILSDKVLFLNRKMEDITQQANLLLPIATKLFHKSLIYNSFHDYTTLSYSIIGFIAFLIIYIYSKRNDPPGYLTLNLIGAEGLRPADGKSADPYAIIRFRGIKQSYTQVKKDKLNPEWNHTVVFDITKPDIFRMLYIDIFDKDRASKDDKLGKMEVEVRDIVNGKYRDDYFDLTGKDATGKVHIKFSYQHARDTFHIVSYAVLTVFTIVMAYLELYYTFALNWWQMGIVFFLSFVFGLIYFLMKLGSIIKTLICKYGYDYIKVPIKVEAMWLNIFKGLVGFRGFVVGNPPGYTSPHLLRIDLLDISINIMSFITGATGIVHQVLIKGTNINYEMASGKVSNLDEFLDLLDGDDDNEDEPKKEDEKKKKKKIKPQPILRDDENPEPGPIDFVPEGHTSLIVEDILVKKTQVKLTASFGGRAAGVPLNISDIHIENLGKEGEGVTIKLILKIVMKTILKSTAHSLFGGGKFVAGIVKDCMQEVGGAICRVFTG